ncbi:MAG TPA: glutamate--cysteine ligase [Acidimicrobiia bacterium]|nr:glutamate--cysteine ligase [Acidimicrobiia bacterium]
MQITFGVEEEYFLVDAAGGALVAGSGRVLPGALERLGVGVTTELNLCQIEGDTPVCTTLDQLRTELGRLRSGLTAAARAEGLAVVALASHPFSAWEDQRIDSGNPRYVVMEERYETLAREQIICGCHVHLGFGNRDLEILVLDRIRPWLPVLLALSANSPFWQGADTGYASYRTQIWTRWPTAGMPPDLGSRARYEEVVAELVSAGAIADPTHLYWYARPSVRFPTLEFRICDVCLGLDDSVAIAGLIRGLAWVCAADAIVGSPKPATSPTLLDAAVWRASRFGLTDQLVHPLTAEPQPAAVVVEALLDVARPGLEAHDDWAEVTDLVARIMTDGTGAERQRAAFRAGGSVGVVEEAMRGMAPNPVDEPG